MNNFYNFDTCSDLDSLVDLETFNAKFYGRNISDTEDENIIDTINQIKTKCFANGEGNFKVIQIKQEKNKKNSNTISESKVTNSCKKSADFSLEKYIRRIANRILNKKGLRNMILNLISKEEIDLQNLIHFRKLNSQSKKKDYVESLVNVIMNVIEK